MSSAPVFCYTKEHGIKRNKGVINEAVTNENRGTNPVFYGVFSCSWNYRLLFSHTGPACSFSGYSHGKRSAYSVFGISSGTGKIEKSAEERKVVKNSGTLYNSTV